MIFNYRRRPTRVVRVGNLEIGGENPVRLQSMTNTPTLDTEACVAQTLRLAEAGAELVRLTTQGVREASNMKEISRRLREAGCMVPLAADVHFNPAAAFEAARHCGKVRINPGNFADAVHRFEHIEYSDEEYASELDRIRERLLPFLQECRSRGVALRLGVNHGSLSDRITSRFGDTPRGMVESVMEYLRICRAEDFNDIVISVKASNVTVMVDTVRLLAATMEREDMHFPLHLGVTEAGNEDEGRVKSAVGIGTLLSEGLGDTIRVSLSEEPEREIPVAAILRDIHAARMGHPHVKEPASTVPYPSRSHSVPFPAPGIPSVEGVDFNYDDIPHISVDAAVDPELPADCHTPVAVSSRNINAPAEIASWIERFQSAGGRNPIVLSFSYDSPAEEAMVRAASDIGTLLLNGYGSAVHLDITALGRERSCSIALMILQACRLRFSRPDYIACPGCGRTLFDLQSVLADVKRATSHLKGMKIAVMGCIVNGPGEMADADFGYVGAGPGKVSLYKGRELVRKNIPTEEALPELLSLIERETSGKI